MIFLVVANLPLVKDTGEILNADIFCNSSVHYVALIPWVSTFLGIPDSEFDILNIFIKIILLGMHYHFR